MMDLYNLWYGFIFIDVFYFYFFSCLFWNRFSEKYCEQYFSMVDKWFDFSK